MATALLLLVRIVGGMAAFLIGGPVGNSFLRPAGVAGLTRVVFLVGTTRQASGVLFLLGVVAVWPTIDPYIERQSLGVRHVLYIGLALVVFPCGYQYPHTDEQHRIVRLTSHIDVSLLCIQQSELPT